MLKNSEVFTVLSAAFLGQREITVMTTPFIMMPLAHYAWHQLAKHEQLARYTAFALLSAWFSDVFWVFKDQEIFFGLGAFTFLASYCYYLRVFWRYSSRKNTPKFTNFLCIVYFLVPSLGIVLLLEIVKPSISDWILIGGYALFLAFMLQGAMSRYHGVSQKSFILCMGGAVCFVISAGIMVYQNHFSPVVLGDFGERLSLVLAQFLIVSGLITYVKDRGQRREKKIALNCKVSA